MRFTDFVRPDVRYIEAVADLIDTGRLRITRDFVVLRRGAVPLPCKVGTCAYDCGSEEALDELGDSHLPVPPKMRAYRQKVLEYCQRSQEAGLAAHSCSSVYFSA